MVLTQDDKARTVIKTQLRAVGLSVGAGLVVSSLLIGLVDGLLAARAHSRESRRTRSDPVTDVRLRATAPTSSEEEFASTGNRPPAA